MKRTTKQAKRFLKKQTKKQQAAKTKANKQKRDNKSKWPTGPTNRTSYPR